MLRAMGWTLPSSCCSTSEHPSRIAAKPPTLYSPRPPAPHSLQNLFPLPGGKPRNRRTTAPPALRSHPQHHPNLLARPRRPPPSTTRRIVPVHHPPPRSPSYPGGKPRNRRTACTLQTPPCARLHPLLSSAPPALEPPRVTFTVHHTLRPRNPPPANFPTNRQADKLVTLAPPPCIRCARLHPVFAPPRSHLFPPYPGVNQKNHPPAEPRPTTSRPPSTTSTGTHRVTFTVHHTLHPRSPTYPGVNHHTCTYLLISAITTRSSRTPPPPNAAKRPNPIPPSYPGVNQKLTHPRNPPPAEPALANFPTNRQADKLASTPPVTRPNAPPSLTPPVNRPPAALAYTLHPRSPYPLPLTPG